MLSYPSTLLVVLGVVGAQLTASSVFLAVPPLLQFWRESASVDDVVSSIVRGKSEDVAQRANASAVVLGSSLSDLVNIGRLRDFAGFAADVFERFGKFLSHKCLWDKLYTLWSAMAYPGAVVCKARVSGG